MCRGVPSSLSSLHHLLFAVRMAVLSDKIWFLVVLIDIPPVITKDVEYLGCLVWVFFVFFSLEI